MAPNYGDSFTGIGMSSEYHQSNNSRRCVYAVMAFVACSISGCMSKPIRTHSQDATITPFVRDHVTSINGVSISSDNQRLYATHWFDDPGSPRSQRRATIVLYTRSHDTWVEQGVVPFSGVYDDSEACETVDGEWLYFASRRPLPGSEQDWIQPNIWRTHRISENEWGDPEYLHEVNSMYYDGYPCLTEDGSLYFSSNRPGGPGDVDIFVSRLENLTHTSPLIVDTLSSASSDNDAYIARDQTIAIIPRNVDESFENIKLFMSKNLGHSWTEPIEIDSINQPGWNLSPNLTPDRQTLIWNVPSRGGLVQTPWPPIVDLLPSTDPTP